MDCLKIRLDGRERDGEIVGVDFHDGPGPVPRVYADVCTIPHAGSYAYSGRRFIIRLRDEDWSLHLSEPASENHCLCVGPDRNCCA